MNIAKLTIQIIVVTAATIAGVVTGLELSDKVSTRFDGWFK